MDSPLFKQKKAENEKMKGIQIRKQFVHEQQIC